MSADQDSYRPKQDIQKTFGEKTEPLVHKNALKALAQALRKRRLEQIQAGSVSERNTT